MSYSYLKQVKGYFYVICGPMFAGKSEELLRILNRLKYAKIDYLVFKPKLDTRSINNIKSRDGRTLSAIEIDNVWDIYDHLKDIKKRPFCVAFDELHFFSSDIIEVIKTLVKSNFYVIASGLDTDFNHKPFSCMPDCLAIADKIKKLSAICIQCGQEAAKSQRIVNSSDQILVGDAESYEARCSNCHQHNIPDSEYSEFTLNFLKKIKN